jgi:hypothetical protein
LEKIKRKNGKKTGFAAKEPCLRSGKRDKPTETRSETGEVYETECGCSESFDAR